MKRLTMFGCLLGAAAFAVLALWFSHGADLATREKVPVEVTSIDDFGDEVKTVEWKEPTGFPVLGFHVGLDRAGPVAGGLGGLGCVLLFVGFRRSRA